jgi:ribonuclease BN (tRNA processing enzyme)
VAEREHTFTLTVLGAGPAWSDRPDSAGASYLLRSDRTAIVLDLGQGAFPRLIGAIEPANLDAVLVSHLHPDHFIDLVPLRHYLRYEFDPPRHVRVIGPAGLAARIDALHDRPGFTAATLDCEAFRTGVVFAIGDLTIEARRVTHTADSHAIRVSRGDEPGLVYSGDCGVAADLAPLIRVGDTLLVEVSLGADPAPADAIHLDAASIAELVRATRPARVLLTHIEMRRDRIAPVGVVGAAFDGPVQLVEPGDRFDLSPT